MANQVVWASYPTAVVVVVLFGTFAGVYTYLRHKKVGKDTTEFFLTARRTVVRMKTTVVYCVSAGSFRKAHIAFCFVLHCELLRGVGTALLRRAGGELHGHSMPQRWAAGHCLALAVTLTMPVYLAWPCTPSPQVQFERQPVPPPNRAGFAGLRPHKHVSWQARTGAQHLR